MHRPHAVPEHGCSPSVVVHNLNVYRTAFRPAEAHAKLVVHADAVLPGTATFQRLQTVARRCTQKIQRFSRIELLQRKSDPEFQSVTSRLPSRGWLYAVQPADVLGRNVDISISAQRVNTASSFRGLQANDQERTVRTGYTQSLSRQLTHSQIIRTR